MVNSLYPAINWFIQLLEALPPSLSSFLFWVLACFAVVLLYNIIHMWVT